jgi:hypothetical protein
VCFLNNHPRGQAFMQRLRKRHGDGKALSILAARLGRATFFMLKQRQASDMKRFFQN